MLNSSYVVPLMIQNGAASWRPRLHSMLMFVLIPATAVCSIMFEVEHATIQISEWERKKC